MPLTLPTETSLDGRLCSLMTVRVSCGPAMPRLVGSASLQWGHLSWSPGAGAAEGRSLRGVVELFLAMAATAALERSATPREATLEQIWLINKLISYNTYLYTCCGLTIQ